MAKVTEEWNLVNLIIAVLHPESRELEPIISPLSLRFGEIELISKSFSFSHTSYYEKEMGRGIVKTILAFKNLVRDTDMKVIKYFTLQLEDEFKENRNRVYNLDPGYVDLNKLVLSTTKGRAHRTSIGWGLYEEVTLLYRKGTFENLLWTYPSYKSEEVKSFLVEVREKYKEKLRTLRNEKGKSCHSDSGM